MPCGQICIDVLAAATQFPVRQRDNNNERGLLMYIRTSEGSPRALLQHVLGDPPTTAHAAEQRFKRVAALVTKGLTMAKDAIPQLSVTGKQELLRFMTSLLETYFFPRGHGLVDAQGKVLRQSKIGTIAVPVIAKDGSCWPRFEYRVRLSLSDRILDPKLRGRHVTAHFSNIFLFTHALQGTASSRAVLTALHEMTHMLFAMVRSLEHLCGTGTVPQLLLREPWQRLDLSGFAGHRGNLERHVRDLLRVLPIPMQAGELAASLIEEAFAFMFGVIVDEAIARSEHIKKRKPGHAVLPTVDFSPESFVTAYVLEREFNVTAQQMKSAAAQQIFQRMTGEVTRLAAAMRAHIDG